VLGSVLGDGLGLVNEVWAGGSLLFEGEVGRRTGANERGGVVEGRSGLVNCKYFVGVVATSWLQEQ